MDNDEKFWAWHKNSPTRKRFPVAARSHGHLIALNKMPKENEGYEYSYGPNFVGKYFTVEHKATNSAPDDKGCCTGMSVTQIVFEPTGEILLACQMKTEELVKMAKIIDDILDSKVDSMLMGLE